MPLPILTVKQMREWEAATWRTGQTEGEVIRRVGLELARRANQEVRMRCGTVLVLAGKGNNGADARAAMPHFKPQAELLDLNGENGEPALLDEALKRRPALLIDGLFGIGLNRPLRGPWIEIIGKINASGCPVLAVDVPSGLNAETGQPQPAALRAAVTLTVGAPKAGLLKESAWPFVGRLEVMGDVGLIPCNFPSELRWTLAEDFRDFPPPRTAASHKGTFGHVAILAGSLGFHGAAVLAARGAQRAQPGLITVFTFPEVYLPVAAQSQAVMVHPLKDAVDFSKYDAVLVGPGLAAPECEERVRPMVDGLWRSFEKPVIVDASALPLIPPGVSPRGLRVITPHPGEAGRLLGTDATQVQADRLGSLRNLSKKFGNCFVVLKGHQSLVGRDTGEVLVNSSGNPHLAQGGSGDLLGGYVTGLLAQERLQPDPMRTLSFAVWQHGASADLLQQRSANWVIEDLALTLGSARTEQAPD